MSTRVEEINNLIGSVSDVQLIKPFTQGELFIEGRVSIFVEGLEQPLAFDVLIYPQYPFKSHDTETIKFFNSDLLEYKHIMRDGSICIHTAHSSVLSQKLIYDLYSVKAWIKKYYINKDTDTHYEHLITPQTKFKGEYFAFFFNTVDYSFYENQYGYVDCSTINRGAFYNEKINSNILQGFYDEKGKLLIELKWNDLLKSLNKNRGLFIFLKNAPSKNQRWVFEKWEDFAKLLPKDFLNFIHVIEKRYFKDNGKCFPLFVGYNISEIEIHWEVIILEIGDFPIYGEKVNKQWGTRLEEKRIINWGMTKNCSYKYFFGRGHLNEKIIKSKILIIGVGAIGSIIAKTFVRSGCTNIDFIDYDVKEPENVCRSEYSFASGINNKTNDLVNELLLISPYFMPRNIGYNFSEEFDFLIKSYFTNKEIKSSLEKFLNEYDIIIDCSTDNDLLYVLSRLSLTSEFLNLSISNHAKHLVCAVEQNRYEFITTQFNGNALKVDSNDLYNPTGCWSPTFKASYNVSIRPIPSFSKKHSALPL